MSSPLSRRMLPALFCATALAGCGGGSTTAPLPQPIVLPPAAPAPPVPPPVPPAPAALMASSESLALAVSGQARQFVITNGGGQDALNLAATATTALPVGTSFTSDCATLAPGASCTLTITPGAMPSAAPGDTAPVPVELHLAGSNTNALALSVWVLGFGSVYQGGYVFDLNDGTPTTGGVSGKVMALQDVPGASRPWGPNDSATLLGLSNTDGAANTAAIVQRYGPPANEGNPLLQYPAWACRTSSAAGFSDWYLPAICELGYDGNNRGSGCGTVSAPTLPNVQSQLVNSGHATGLPSFSQYWSSSVALGTVWAQLVRPDASHHHQDLTAGANGTRCVRALTP